MADRRRLSRSRRLCRVDGNLHAVPAAVSQCCAQRLRRHRSNLAPQVRRLKLAVRRRGGRSERLC